MQLYHCTPSGSTPVCSHLALKTLMYYSLKYFNIIFSIYKHVFSGYYVSCSFSATPRFFSYVFLFFPDISSHPFLNNCSIPFLFFLPFWLCLDLYGLCNWHLTTLQTLMNFSSQYHICEIKAHSYFQFIGVEMKCREPQAQLSAT